MADEVVTGEPDAPSPGTEREFITPGVEIAFGPHKRIVPPLNLGALKILQKRIADLKGFDEASIDTVIDAVHAALKRNYRGVERAFVEAYLDTSNTYRVMDSLMSVSGLTPRGKEGTNGAGKSAAVEANSTGASSTAT